MRTFLHLIPLSLAITAVPFGAATSRPSQETATDLTLVHRALANELEAAKENSHPLRYRLRKSSPRLTTTKELVETRDGVVAVLVAVNDRPLTADEAQKEQARLNALLADSGKQRHRKQVQEDDTARALKVLRVLPQAFLYQYAGPVPTNNNGIAEKFTFIPNPKFDPPDLETQVLTAMAGELWIDPVHARVIHLQGKLRQDVDFGWGILGRLYKGGWITIDQAEVLPGIWRVSRFQMKMSARLVFRTRTFETVEEQSDFAPVPAGITYQEGVAMLRIAATLSGAGAR